jgi:hypothetical protein
VFRLAACRPLAGVLLVAVLAGCGAPPEPPPTAPPAPRESTSLGPSGVPLPPGGLPPGGLPSGGLPSGYPAGALPPGGVPTVAAPTYPTPAATRPIPSPSPIRSTPPPAPVCRNGPSKQQVLGVIKGKPGIPTRPLEVRFGPYCAGSWQLSIIGIVGETADEEEQLLVVTSGRPAALTLVEAGTDVCTDRVEDDAPAGIRVRACGS